MTVVKTTIVVDEKTWNEFKRAVSFRYGSLRKISLAVEEALKGFNAAESLEALSKSLGFVINAYPSLREVEERRPRIGTSAGEEVRGMRDERQARLSRLK